MNVLNLISLYYQKYFSTQSNQLKVVLNIGWLFAERILKLSLGLLVSIYAARYFGPHDFGILSYAISVTTFLGSFVYLGLSGIVVQDLVKQPHEADTLLGACFTLKMLGACFGYSLLLAFVHCGGGTSVEKSILLVTGLLLFFQPMDTIDFWFQSKTESKYSVIAKSAAFFLLAIVKLGLLLKGVSLLFFASATLAEYIFVALFLIGIYFFRGGDVRSWRVSIAKMIALLKRSWILILSGFLSLVYLKIDQIMLRWMVDSTEVGIYSVAVTFSEVWYFIPTIIAVSVFPTLVELNQKDKRAYDKRLQQTFDVLFTIAFLVAIVVSLSATSLIGFLYGQEYVKAGGILSIHVWAGIFIFMRALFSKWIIIENLLQFSLYSHGLGALTNVVLNLLLIDYYGGYGAAIATFFSYAAASYFMLFLTAKSRPVAFMMSKSLIFPVRLLLFGKKIW